MTLIEHDSEEGKRDKNNKLKNTQKAMYEHVDLETNRRRKTNPFMMSAHGWKLLAAHRKVRFVFWATKEDELK